jgi:hypothetical protein
MKCLDPTQLGRSPAFGSTYFAYSCIVRVRIVKPGEGVLDSISLSHLIPTCAYDLNPSTAQHLIASGCAEEIATSTPALVVPVDEPSVLEVLTRGVSITSARAIAADEPRRTRKKR